MASNCGRKSLRLAASSAKTLLSRRSPSLTSSSSSNANKFNSSAFQSSTHKRSFSWLPVQLACAQVSLTPLHSVTASALFTSLLSLHSNTWGILSEGFATPL